MYINGEEVKVLEVFQDACEKVASRQKNSDAFTAESVAQKADLLARRMRISHGASEAGSLTVKEQQWLASFMTDLTHDM